MNRSTNEYPEAQAPATANRRVLVVEDDAEFAPLLHHLLQQQGYEVIAAADGRQAARLIGQAAPPRVALVETFLPYRGGFELLAMIRGRASWDGVRVAMLSNNGSGADHVRARLGGADVCLVKPIRSELLLQWLSSTKRNRPALPEARPAALRRSS